MDAEATTDPAMTTSDVVPGKFEPDQFPAVAQFDVPAAPVQVAIVNGGRTVAVSVANEDVGSVAISVGKATSGLEVETGMIWRAPFAAAQPVPAVSVSFVAPMIALLVADVCL
jgi:hypothetical protein